MASVVRTDGFVDRHLNRKCSRPLTLLFLKTSLTPNSITLLAMFIGLGAAAAFAYGGDAGGIIGALLFQLSLIVDCCDGEVARIKHLESPFGDRFDLLADNMVHIAIIAGITWAAYREEGLIYVLLGMVAATGMLIDLFVILRDSPANGATESLLNNFLVQLTNRDFSVLILFLALVSKPEWFIWFAAIGSHIYWLLYLWQRRVQSQNR